MVFMNTIRNNGHVKRFSLQNAWLMHNDCVLISAYIAAKRAWICVSFVKYSLDDLRINLIFIAGFSKTFSIHSGQQ